MVSNFSTLEKLTIKSYSSAERNDKSPEEFKAMFNPESYSLTYNNVFDGKQGINTSGRPSRYLLSKPEVLKIKLILDGNGVNNMGVINLFETKDVYTEVQKFLKMTSNMDGETHQPGYLTLKWGDLYFKCRLNSVSVNYTQFNSSGIPLRAELDTEFMGDLETSERLKKENKSSPDLTHYRIVGAHDQLPLMCQKIYGSPNYYIEVAKVNKLKNFRNLQPGQKIYFPPIAK